jgi:AcrR family transcriptional regulator
MARTAVDRKARRPATALAKGKAVAAPRATRQAERREAILNAALDEFAARGFAATRLEDVAARAGIAKGTIYLYFHSKQSLFQELVRTALSPVVGKVLDAGLAQLPVRAVGEAVADLFIREIFGTRRKDVIRLVIAEGPRFPKIAEFYYHEVIERVVPAMRAVMENALARGELKNEALARFPQLLVAPGLLALIWEALFGRFAPLDIAALMRAHIDLIFGKGAPQ